MLVTSSGLTNPRSVGSRPVRSSLSAMGCSVYSDIGMILVSARGCDAPDPFGIEFELC